MPHNLAAHPPDGDLALGAPAALIPPEAKGPGPCAAGPLARAIPVPGRRAADSPPPGCRPSRVPVAADAAGGGAPGEARGLLVSCGPDDLGVRDLASRAPGLAPLLDWARVPEDALEAIGRGRHDVVLVLLHPDEPGADGLGLLRRVAEGSFGAPLIVLDGRGGPDDAQAAVLSGADDYLVLGRTDPEQLGRSVRRAVRCRRAEQTAREADRFARSVLDSLAASIAVLDAGGTILAVNRAWRHFAAANAPPGAPVCEGANYLRVCDGAEGDDAPGARAFAAAVRDVLAGRRSEFALEYPCHAPGRPRWFIGRVTRFAGDGPLRAVVAHEDVTDRKLAEERLARSEARLRVVLDHVEAAIFLKDLEGRYLLVNRRFLDRFGLSEGDVVGKTDDDFVPPDVAAAFRESDRRALAGGAPFETEEVAPYRDGPRTLIVIKVPLAGADGVPYAVCGIATDITERHRAETALRESESILRSFFDGTPAALAVAEVTGDDFRVILANASLARTLGQARGEPPADRARGLEVPPDRRRRWLDAYHEASRLGRPTRYEHRGAPAEGPEWLSELIIPIADDPAGRSRFCVVAEDVTARKRAEQEIFVLNAELEARLGRISSLREIDRAITSCFDLTLTLGVVLDQALTRLGLDAAGILLGCPQIAALEYAVRKGYHGGSARGVSVRLDDGPVGRAVIDRRTQQLLAPAGGEGGCEAAAMPAVARSEGFVSYWAVPLVTRGGVRGVLEAGHRSSLRPEPEWLEFLEALAGQAAIAVESADLFEGLHRSNLELALAYDATIEGWSRAMDLRDHETEGHSRRVTEMNLRLARAMGVSEPELIHARRGALLHDIGKIGIPDRILLKPGRLDDDEFAVMKRHPEYALEMLAPIAFLRPALDIPYCHHEKWDGTGYPRGLKGEQIPLAARIFAAVDIWDALSHDRPYRRAWPPDRVLAHLRSLSGTHLDPRVVDAFLKVLASDQLGPGGVEPDGWTTG